MLDRNRLLIAASIGGLIVFSVAGGLALGSTWRADNGQAYPRYQNPEYNPPRPATGNAVVQTSKYREPCKDPKGNDESDLCAQWNAAQAASDAAQWAWWQMWLSALGVIGLAATLWFNFRALKIAEDQARETVDALEVAERNAAAAAKLAETAERTAERQLRAYISVEAITLGDTKAIATKVSSALWIRIANFGETPAHLKKISCKIVYSEPDLSLVVYKSETDTQFTIAKGGHIDLPVTVEDVDAFIHTKGRESGIFIASGELKYVDVFHFARRTNFAFATFPDFWKTYPASYKLQPYGNGNAAS
jgi:hypothetical protein